MKRDYASGVDSVAELFVGTEIEHTPAKDMKTLFVVGIKTAEELLEICRSRNIKHIYLGANHSFTPELMVEFEHLALDLLDEGMWITLDMDVRFYEGALDTLVVLSEHDRFILQISVKLPYLTNLNYNATIKIDDKDFRSTNPGVWVHQIHDLMDRRRFTSWDQYGSDEIINKIVRT